MARAFSGNNQYLNSNQSSIPGLPTTLSAWVRTPAAPLQCNNRFPVSLGNVQGQSVAIGVTVDNGGNPIFYGSINNMISVHSNVPLSGNTWYHVAVVFNNDGTQSLFVNGQKSTGTDTTTVQNLLGRTGVGCRYVAGVNGAWIGRIEEVAIWKSALSDADIALLAAGATSPASIQSSDLKNYWRLLGIASPEPDSVSGNNLNVTGATSAAHDAPITY